MNEDQIVKQIYEKRMNGWRRGRLRKTWWNRTDEILKKRDETLQELKDDSVEGWCASIERYRVV